MSRKELVESRRLQAAIEAIENALFNADGVSIRNTNTNMLVKFLDDAKKRAESLELSEKNITEEERRKANNELAAVAYLVAKETALNEREREQYGIFLLSEFFTKSDFTELEQFYASAWDRLTEEGKAQMSHRIWEGVRHGEYQFNDLPEDVKAKEAQRLYDQILMRKPPAEILNIPKQDRDDFIREWRLGNHSKSYEILNQPVFGNNVALSAKPISSTSAEIATAPEASKTVQTENEAPKQSGDKVEDTLGTSEFGLDDLHLADNGFKPPLSGLPPASGSKTPMIR